MEEMRLKFIIWISKVRDKGILFKRQFVELNEQNSAENLMGLT